MKHNINIYKSTNSRRTLKVFELFEDDVVIIPDDSIILHTESIGDGIEIWAAVPSSSIVSSRQYDVDLEDDNET